MFKKTNLYDTALYAAIYCASLLYPTITMADEKTRIAPLHIKIGAHNKNKSKGSFNIQMGKIPAKTSKGNEKKSIKKSNTIEPENKHDTIMPAIAPISVTATKIPKAKKAVIKPKIIETMPCHEISSANSNHNYNLADSLITYIKSKNRDPSIISDIHDASIAVNIDFELLIVKAMIESDLGRVTTSKTSSARGIFQYIEPTWLVLMKRYGDKIGQSEYANAIKFNLKTHIPEVNNNNNFTKDDILALRQNTKIAALIKSYQIKDEAKIIKKYKNNRRINATDHYIAHMLGLTQARNFYQLLNNASPIILADSVSINFKEAIRLNSTFFYDNNNNALTAKQAYKQFHQKISNKYKDIRAISAKYGDGKLNGGHCNIPEVKTVYAQEPIVTASKNLDLPQLSADIKTYKVKITRN